MDKSVLRIFFLQVFLICSVFSYSQLNTDDTSLHDTISNQDDLVSPHPISSNRLLQMPLRSVYGIVLNSPNSFYLKGGQMVVDGIGSTGNDIFIEGMQVNDGNDFPFRAIADYLHYRLNQPMKYGNVAGSLIELKTPEYTDKIHFDLDGYMSTNRETLKYTAIELNVGGPIRFGKQKDKMGFVPGFYLASNYTFTNDPDPSWEKKYKTTTETQSNITNNPLVPSGLYNNGTYLSAEFLRTEDMQEVKSHQNADRNKSNTFLKFMFPITKNINLSVGSYAKFDNGKEFVFDNALLNSQNNPETCIRNFDNFLNFDHKIDLNSDLSLSYNVNFQYSNYYFQREDARFQDRYFEYGYLGKYQTYKSPSYMLGDIEIDGTVYENVWMTTSWDYDTAYTFQNIGYNPELSRFTDQVYKLFPGSFNNSDDLQLSGGLLNGQSPQSVYGIWNSQGDPRLYSELSPGRNLIYRNSYGYSQSEKYRGTFQMDVNYKKHDFFIGFEYVKNIERSYQITPNELWTMMRGWTNFHITELDLSNPKLVYDNGMFQDTVMFYRRYDESSQFDFDKNLRKKLGLPVDGLDFILTDSYDIKNNTIDYYDKDGVMHTVKVDGDFYSLDMFSPEELLNNGFYIVDYMGYDYLGNKLKGKRNPYDAYSNWQVGAYSPAYFSAFVGDKFFWKFLDVTAGLRIDHFNANQPVLKDKYSLYEIYTAAESSNCCPGSPPENIGDDYAVYVDNVYNPTEITGYRSGDTWYDDNGNEIDNPYILDRGSGISPYLVDPYARMGSTSWKPDMTFENYAPTTYLLPQININMRNSFVNVYANYNSFSQNPITLNVFKPFDYLYMNSISGIKNNSALKPIRTDKVSVGIQPRIYKNLYADFGYLGAFVRNDLYIDRIEGAYPRDYYTVLNYDDVHLNHSYMISLNYFSQKFPGIGASSSLMKSFVWDSSKEYLDIPDMIINTNLTFNFGYGRDFILPQNKVLQAIFENFGIGVYHQFRNGTNLKLIDETIQEYYVTPNFCIFNLRVEKGVYIKPIDLTVSIYIWVENLLNKQNLFYINPFTGEPDDDGFLSSPATQDFINLQVDPESFRQLYQMKLYNPAYYDTPRICRVGAIIKI